MIVTVRVMGAIGPRRVDSLEFPDGPPPTVREVVRAFLARHPAIERRYGDGAGGIGPGVNVILGRDNVRRLGGLDIPAVPGKEIWLVHAIAGGR